MAVVTQEVQLFRATLRDNLTFFDRSIADERLLAALEELGLGEWYRRLPEGWIRGWRWAGAAFRPAKAQLLALTRVFLRDPGLVILDEASSRLDPLSEALIEKAMNKLLKARTAIVIAHRLNTVQRADEIMILDEGRIREHGTRESLVGDPASRFYGLLQTGSGRGAGLMKNPRNGKLAVRDPCEKSHARPGGWCWSWSTSAPGTIWWTCSRSRSLRFACQIAPGLIIRLSSTC